mgnify:CR=1 FL=1
MSADEESRRKSDPVSEFSDHLAPEPWRPEIVEAIYALLYRENVGVDRLVADLQKLEEVEGPAVYVELLQLLSHIRFEPEEAREHWDALIRHRETLEEAIGSPVELSVGLVSYFVQVSGKLQNPKVIELKLFEETRASAYKDELTGLHNFRFLQEYLGWEVKRCERHGGEFSIAMGDVDNFKDFNDRFGHQVGNETLQALAVGLKEIGREQDIAVRYGGEEFVLIMPETSKEDAGRVAERVCEAVASIQLSESDPSRGVTMSIGVASFPTDALTQDDLIRCADRAMYIAKARGKNQAQLYGANRRAHRRVEVEMTGELRILKDESLPFSTLDLSERGLRLTAAESLPLSSIVEFVLTLPGDGQKIKAYGRVMRAAECEDGGYEMALTIMDIDSRAYIALTRYLNTQGKKAISEVDTG